MSFHDIFTSPAFWGLAGAFIWAGPEWLACIFSDGKGPKLKCTLEFIVRLLTGVLAAAAFTPWVLEIFHNSENRTQPIAALIGLMANTTAPKLVDVLSARALKVFKGDSK